MKPYCSLFESQVDDEQAARRGRVKAAGTLEARSSKEGAGTGVMTLLIQEGAVMNTRGLSLPVQHGLPSTSFGSVCSESSVYSRRRRLLLVAVSYHSRAFECSRAV